MSRESSPPGLCLPEPSPFPRVIVLVVILAFVLVMLRDGYDLAGTVAVVTAAGAVAVMLAERLAGASWRPSAVR